MRSCMPIAIGVWLGVGLLSAHAQTKEPSKAELAAARDHYKKAVSAEKKEKYDEAVSEYILAYDITKDAKLFYQIAKANDRGGQSARALVYYRRYLAETKVSEAGRKEVEARIAEISAAEAKASPVGADKSPAGRPGAEKSAKSVPPARALPKFGDDDTGSAGAQGDAGAGLGEAPPPFLAPEKSWKRTAGWISIGVAGAFLTSAAVMATSAQSREDDLNRLLFVPPNTLPPVYQGSVRTRYEDAVSDGKRFNDLTIYSLVGAGASVAFAVLFFTLDDTPTVEKTAATSTVTPFVGADQAGFSAAFRF